MNELYQIIIAATPVASSIICILFLLFAYGDRILSIERYLKRLLLIYFCQMIFNWIFNLMVQVPGSSFQYILPFVAFNLHLMQVVFFHVIVIITSMGEQKRIGGYHYVIPFLLSFAVSLFFFSSLSFFPSHNDVFNFFIPYLFISVALYSVYYTYLMIRHLYDSYTKLMSEGRYEDWSKIKWLNYVLFFRILLLITFIGLYSFTSYNNLLYALFIPVQHLILTYNLLQRNYVLKKTYLQINKILMPSGRIENDVQVSISEEKDNIIEVKEEATSILSQAQLDSYFRENKPFLDPDLKMEQMVKIFNTNRAYFSKFVNVAYGVNFSNYINMWRLRELDSLMEDPEHKEKDLQTLITMAGFGSLRNYWRVKKKLEEKHKNDKYSE